MLIDCRLVLQSDGVLVSRLQGNECELCKTPRSKDRHGVLLSTCGLCGYHFADLGSSELRETRQLAERITLSPATKGVLGLGLISAIPPAFPAPAPPPRPRK